MLRFRSIPAALRAILPAIAAVCLTCIAPGCGDSQIPSIRSEQSHTEAYRQLVFEYAEELTIASDPSDQPVYIDGRLAGRTPLTTRIDFGAASGSQQGIDPLTLYSLWIEDYDKRTTGDRFFRTEEYVLRGEYPIAYVAKQPTGSPLIWTDKLHLIFAQSSVRIALGSPDDAAQAMIVSPSPDDPVVRASLRQAGLFGPGDPPARILGRRVICFPAQSLADSPQ